VQVGELEIRNEIFELNNSLNRIPKKNKPEMNFLLFLKKLNFN
jgi:hypothetical protein